MAVLCSEIWLLIGVVFVLQLPVIRSQLCHQGWTFHAPTGSCMALIREKYGYYEAINYCEAYFDNTTKEEGHLVFIFDKATDEFVKELLNEGHVDRALIGVHDGIRNGQYVWGYAPEIPVNYTGWAVNPHTPVGHKQLVVMTKDGWQEHDYPSDNDFVCQVNVGTTVRFEMNITPNKTEQLCTIGVNHVLTCRASITGSSQRPSIHWEIRGVQVTATDKNARIRIERGHYWSLVLRVDKVQAGDEGTYTCVVTLGSHMDSRNTTVVVVRDNVGFEMKIIPEQTQQLYNIGDTHVLKCMASVTDNNQRPSIHWEINGVQVTATDKDARVRIDKETEDSLWLRVDKVQDGDEGTYKCVGTLGSQTDSKSTTVVVHHHQNVGFEMQIIPEQIHYPFSIGDNRAIKCIASVAENNQRPSLHWQIRGVQVTATNINARVRIEGETDGSLMLRVSKVQDGDEGIYTCVATLGSQTDSRSTKVVVVQDLKVLSSTSQFGIFGTDGYVKCEVVAKPAPSTTWKFNNGTKIQSGTKYIIQQDQMIIKDLNDGDTAKYLCDIVVIEVGDTRAFIIDYQVVRLPKIDMIPTISPNNPKVGDLEVKITCHATGFPQPTYEYRKDGNNIPAAQVDEQSGILTIIDLKREDEGVYTCVAKNRGGSDERSNYLDVKPPVTPASKNGGSQAHDVGAIVGVITAAILVIILFGVLIFLWRKKGAPCKRTKHQHANTPVYAIFKNDKPGSRHDLEELPQTHAPENPQ